jgi:hypothetical protein
VGYRRWSDVSAADEIINIDPSCLRHGLAALELLCDHACGCFGVLRCQRDKKWRGGPGRNASAYRKSQLKPENRGFCTSTLKSHLTGGT